MKPSEELMLLLELNNYDVTRYKLKMQLEYEKTGNLDLFNHKKYANMILSHYLYVDDHNDLHKNPLTYRSDWDQGIKSIHQFYVKHHDIEGEITLGEFLLLDSFNEVNKESILYDILDAWVEEYREASIRKMENLKEMVSLIPKKSKKYRKPSKITLLFSVLLALVLMLLFKNPSMLQSSILVFLSSFVTDWNQLLYDIPWYSLFGVLTIAALVLYAVLNNAFSRFIRDVRSEKSKHAKKAFDKWEEDMKRARLKQSGLLEDYIERVIKNPNKNELEIAKLIAPKTLLDKFTAYVKMVDHKYDFMTKHYKKMMKILRLIFVFAFLTNVAFIGVGFAILRGWIHV